MSSEEPVIRFTRKDIPHTATIIWLHGLGADGNDFVPIIPHLKLSKERAVKFVFPQAPIRPVTINAGYEMRAWYDILDMSLDRKVDLDDLVASANYVAELIDGELKAGIASENIIVAGFSQGGAVAIHAALRFPKKLGGLICLSTYLVGEEGLEKSLTENNRQLPIFWGHGREDDVVLFDYGQRSCDQLKSWHFDVGWHEYPISHEVCLEEIREVGQFINSRFA